MQGAGGIPGLNWLLCQIRNATRPRGPRGLASFSGVDSKEGGAAAGVAFLGPLDVEVAWSRCSSAVASGLAEAGIAGIPALAFDEVPCGSLKACLGE